MTDNTLDILIRLQADLAGARASVAELKELKRQAIATGVSTGDLDKQLALAERSADQFQKKVEDAGKKGKGHIEGMHKAVGMLGRQFGEAGHLFHALFMGAPAIAVAALGVGIGLIVEHFQHLKEQIEEAARKLDALNLARIIALRDATSQAAKDMAAYNLSLAQAGESKDPLKGRKFGSPQEELNARSGLQSGLDRSARAATDAAAANRQNPIVIDAAAKLAAALGEEAKLKEAARQAGDPARLRRAYETTTGLEEGGAIPFVAKIKAAEEAARAVALNAEAIASNQAIVTGGGIRQARFDAAATRAQGFATANLGQMTTLGETLTDQERQRRAAINQQFNESGIWGGQHMAGAGAAAVARAAGTPASRSDAVDFNVMMAQVKVEMRKSFAAALAEIFRDGVTSPEEIEKIRAYLYKKTQGP